mmetsp:Transcript_101915/g.202358  ORF Transcript_101915/g.202358 Transcript_101915/m.202358 type:complete len:87 (-) Transcript_101915:1568-1828(-)
MGTSKHIPCFAVINFPACIIRNCLYTIKNMSTQCAHGTTTATAAAKANSNSTHSTTLVTLASAQLQKLQTQRPWLPLLQSSVPCNQ